jgi:hypothetical protein
VQTIRRITGGRLVCGEFGGQGPRLCKPGPGGQPREDIGRPHHGDAPQVVAGARVRQLVRNHRLQFIGRARLDHRTRHEQARGDKADLRHHWERRLDDEGRQRTRRE